MSKKFKKLFLPALALLFLFSACEELEGLSDSEIAAGLKEALEVSTDTSVSQANRENGYYANAAIKIFLPPEVENVANVVRQIPFIDGESLLNKLELELNRAAEDAAGEAKPIFIDAITGITINDALGILNGTDSAATVYLKDRTFVDLKSAFKPKIETSLSKVGAQQTWNTLISEYNSYINSPLGERLGAEPINTDLADYTTDRGLKGLFHLVSEEEKEIRNNVSNRVTDLLRKVFAKQDN
ncbi:MAG: DUF4197 domain-containing protein [Chitinophagales bacterium]